MFTDNKFAIVSGDCIISVGNSIEELEKDCTHWNNSAWTGEDSLPYKIVPVVITWTPPSEKIDG